MHPSGTTLVFDSGHYMGTVQLLCQAIQAHNSGAVFADSGKLNAFLLLDGPLVPLAGAVVFTVLGKLPQAIDWRTFIYIEIFFQAVATASITCLSFNLTNGKYAKHLALGTGLAWALYPPAVLSTDSFLGELPATALLLLALCMMAQTIKLTAAESSLKSNFLALASGLLLALVFMSKPALIVSLGLLVLVWIAAQIGSILPIRENQQENHKKKNTISALVSFALGAAVALTPWLLFTHATTGHWRASAYRVPIYNITRGMSCDSDGWGTVPLDPTMQSYGEGTNALSCMASIFSEKPWQSVNLAIRKPERLFLIPWNDYHRKCLGIGLGLQIFWHQIVLILAAIGLIIMPLGLAKLKNSAARFTAIAAPLVILGHAAYIPFESCSRYGFSATPMLFILCTIAISYIVSKFSKQSKWKVLALVASVIVSMGVVRADLLSLLQALFLPTAVAVLLDYTIKAALLIIVFVVARKLCQPDRAQQRALLKVSSQSIAALMSATVIIIFMAHYLYEREERTWKCPLEAGQSINRYIKYSENSKAKWNLLLIDCEPSKKSKFNDSASDLLANSTISINGKRLTAPSFNPASLIQTWAKLDVMQTDFANIFGKAPATIRQWRAFYIPPGYLESDNTITLEAGQPLTIYGDNDQINGSGAYVPAIDYLSATKFLQEQESPDGRIITPIFQAKHSDGLPASKELLERHDLSPALGRQCGSYRMYIVSGDDSFWQRNSLNTTSYAEAF
ncbi:MAG: hypothetical protein WCT03_18675 [Candidatus Obscuribacterales bacterium]